jgi:hypothetical protein
MRPKIKSEIAGTMRNTFALILLKSDSTFIPHEFWILEFGYNVCLRRINLIKNDRAKQFNKSAFQDPKSKIALRSDLTE